MLGEFLKQKRRSAGLSQRDVSNSLGYSTPQFISNWERGVSNPPISALKKLGSIYKVDPESIFHITLESEIERLTKDLCRKFKSSKAH